MKIRDPNFNVEGLKVIYKQVLFHFQQYQIWKRDSVATNTLATSLVYMQHAEALVSLLEFICTKTNGGGYSGKPKWSLEDRLNSFKPHLGEENNA